MNNNQPKYMETGIGSLTDMLVNLVINEFNKQETRNKVNTTILAPIIYHLDPKGNLY